MRVTLHRRDARSPELLSLRGKGETNHNHELFGKRPAKQFKGEKDDITFSERDAHHVRHPHCDALVIKAMIANNNVHRMLVDNGSSIDILYFQAFKRMGLKVSDLKPSPNLVYGFTGDSVVPLRVISLIMTLREYPR